MYTKTDFENVPSKSFTKTTAKTKYEQDNNGN